MNVYLGPEKFFEPAPQKVVPALFGLYMLWEVMVRNRYLHNVDQTEA